MEGVGYKTKSKMVYDVLKRRIETQYYKQGASIVISTVSKEMDTSAIPVREAMKMLETEGYLKIIPHKGALVTRFSEESIADIIEIRAVLEGLAAKKAMKWIKEADVVRLENLVKDMDTCINSQNVKEFRRLNREFHAIIYKASKCERLCDMISQLWEMSDWANKKMQESPEIMSKSNQEHKEIIHMFKDKNEENVEQYVRTHKLKLKGKGKTERQSKKD